MTKAQPRPSPADLALLDPDGGFLTQLRADWLALNAMRDKGDFTALYVLVHRLAGSAGTFGHGALGEVAMGLDDRYRDGDLANTADLTRLLAAIEATLPPT